MAISNVDVQVLSPKCLASTGDTYNGTVAECERRADEHSDNIPSYAGSESNCFRSAQWSADGTTILTHNEDWRLRTFVLPTNLLEPSDKPLHLSPYSTSSPANTYATALYPHFSLADTRSTLLLQSQKDLPIRLVNTLDLAYAHASYRWIDSNTEAYIAPYSLAFAPDGSSFVAGGSERLAAFDLSRDGEGPVTQMRTRAGKAERKLTGEAGVGLAGLVTALAIGADGTLAAGTTGRQVGLWSSSGLGESIATFSLGEDNGQGMDGSGVTQLAWSPCGRYLFVAERMSDALLVYDIRGAGKRLSWLRGRRAKTTQKLSFDIVNTETQGLDIWAGGTDGVMRIWQDVKSKEGPVNADAEFQAHNDTVSNTIVHPCRTVFATTSGQRNDPQDSVDTSPSPGASDDDMATPVAASRQGRSENVLKVWTL